MTGVLARIFRHPIKSIGVEDLGVTELAPGAALPGDREWAVLHDRAKVTRTADGRASAWAAKANFLTGRAGPALMAVTAQTGAGGRLRLGHPDLAPLEIDPADAADQARLIAWLGPIWPTEAPRPVALVRAPGQPLSDQPRPCLSLIGTASLDALGARAGRRLSPRRFRANLWVEGWEPFAEFALVGRRIRIGGTLLEVTDRIGRCRATDADPDTGRRDIDMLALLDSGWGHTDLGVFCTVLAGGTLRRGDRVEVA